MDINIFENGWNSENAYIFGWIMSDGWLGLEGRNKSAWGVRISSNDYQIIEWLHNKMCDGNKIYHYQNNYMIKYRNQDAINFMKANNLTERKSLSLQFPSIPLPFLPDFIRGFFDGDGSLAITTNCYNTYAQASFTCGSLQFLKSLQDVLLGFGVRSQIYKDGRTANNCYYLRITKRAEIEKLFDLLYRNVAGNAMLQRKYEKFKNYLSVKPKYKSHVA